GFAEGGSVQLVDGRFETPAAPGSAATNTVQLVDPVAYGRLADGSPAAAVLLASNSGGSGTFYELSLVGLLSDGTPVSLAYTFLGDRVKINSLQMQDGLVTVDLLAQGPDDPMCCPTQQQTRAYNLVDGELVQASADGVVSSAPVDPAAPPAGGTPGAAGGDPGAAAGAAPGSAGGLTGTIWQWSDYQLGSQAQKPVDRPQDYRLEFLPGGQVQLQAGCNSGSGSYTAGDAGSGSLSFGALVATQMGCPTGLMGAEFVQYLGQVQNFALRNGALFLTLQDGGILKLVPAR
ncbi:MAG: META domain-containing protein, partial [Chloroflexota bacterium]